MSRLSFAQHKKLVKDTRLKDVGLEQTEFCFCLAITFLFYLLSVRNVKKK
jgi:hypothetical protein